MNNQSANIKLLGGKVRHISVGRGLAPAVFLFVKIIITVGVTTCWRAEICGYKPFVLRREQAPALRLYTLLHHITVIQCTVLCVMPRLISTRRSRTSSAARRFHPPMVDFILAREDFISQPLSGREVARGA